MVVGGAGSGQAARLSTSSSTTEPERGLREDANDLGGGRVVKMQAARARAPLVGERAAKQPAARIWSFISMCKDR